MLNGIKLLFVPNPFPRSLRKLTRSDPLSHGERGITGQRMGSPPQCERSAPGVGRTGNVPAGACCPSANVSEQGQLSDSRERDADTA